MTFQFLKFGNTVRDVNDEEVAFRARFCRALTVADADFEVIALQAFLHKPWSLVSKPLRSMAPKLIATDLEIIRRLGQVTNQSNFSAEVLDVKNDYLRKRDYGFLRRRLRLSRERILNASKGLWRSGQNTTSGPALIELNSRSLRPISIGCHKGPRRNINL